MLLLGDAKIWIYNKPADMRKAITGLSAIIIENIKVKPTNGDIFIFHNKNMNLIKILFWHYNGFCLLSKRLERGVFKIPNNIDEELLLTEKQLHKLLEGMHFINKPEKDYDIFL